MSSLNSVGLAFLGIALSLPAVAVGGVGSDKLVIEASQGCDVKGFQQANCRGDVTIAQGDLLMRSDVVEFQQFDTGARLKAFSLGAKPMEFRRLGTSPRMIVEGKAMRAEYDEQQGSVRLSGGVMMRRGPVATPLDEVRGNSAAWNRRTNDLEVRGGAPTPVNPTGRARLVRFPLMNASAESEKVEPLQLRPSRSLSVGL